MEGAGGMRHLVMLATTDIAQVEWKKDFGA
jgi:hypothetical protein